MTKLELVEKMATAAGITKVAAGKTLSALMSGISNSLKKGQRVSLVGFGTFSVQRRKARKGRNPRTGKEMTIPDCRVPKFSAGKALKKLVR